MLLVRAVLVPQTVHPHGRPVAGCLVVAGEAHGLTAAGKHWQCSPKLAAAGVQPKSRCCFQQVVLWPTAASWVTLEVTGRSWVRHVDTRRVAVWL